MGYLLVGPALLQRVDVGELIKFMCVNAEEGGASCALVTVIGLPWVTVRLSSAGSLRLQCRRPTQLCQASKREADCVPMCEWIIVDRLAV